MKICTKCGMQNYDTANYCSGCGNALDANTSKGKTFGIIGFVLSICGLVFCWIPVINLFTLAESIVGLVFCNISLNNMKFRLANAGRILSIIGIAANGICILAAIILLIVFGSQLLYLIESIIYGIGSGYFF